MHIPKLLILMKIAKTNNTKNLYNKVVECLNTNDIIFVKVEKNARKNARKN